MLEQGAAQNTGIPAWQAGFAFALADMGRVPEAAAMLERAAERRFADIPRDPVYSSALALWAQVAADVGSERAAAPLYDLIEPWRDQVVWNGATGYGSAESYLGALAATLGSHERAHEHFTAASSLHRREGLHGSEPRNLCRFAQSLLAAGAAEEARTQSGAGAGARAGQRPRVERAPGRGPTGDLHGGVTLGARSDARDGPAPRHRRQRREARLLLAAVHEQARSAGARERGRAAPDLRPRPEGEAPRHVSRGGALLRRPGAGRRPRGLDDALQRDRGAGRRAQGTRGRRRHLGRDPRRDPAARPRARCHGDQRARHRRGHALGRLPVALLARVGQGGHLDRELRPAHSRGASCSSAAHRPRAFRPRNGHASSTPSRA